MLNDKIVITITAGVGTKEGERIRIRKGQKGRLIDFYTAYIGEVKLRNGIIAYIPTSCFKNDI